MKRFFSAVRSLLAATALHLLVFGLGGPFLVLVVRPLTRLFPAKRTRIAERVSLFFSRTILFFVRLGGGRVDIRGRIPAAEPCFILMNHQSVLDISVAVLAARPRLPAFVTRKRYARGIPLVSPSIRRLRWPIVDTEGDPAEAIKALVSAVKAHPSLLLFPESHRTRTGELGPFFPAGLWLLFKTQRRPVYLIISDGLWRCSHWRDLFTSLSEISAEAEVLGPFFPPPPDKLRDFIADLHRAMAAKLAEMRKSRGPR